MLGKGTVLPVDSTSLKGKYRTCPIKIVAIKSKEMYLAPSHVSQRLFGCDKRLEWVNHSPVADKWVMTDPHKPLKFKINNPLSRIRHRKPATRGRMCSQNLLIFNGKDLYKMGWSVEPFLLAWIYFYEVWMLLQAKNFPNGSYFMLITG